MANKPVFNSDLLIATRYIVPASGVDCAVPNINSAFGAGSRINSNTFLVGANLYPGVDQTVVRGGDQALLVEANQNIRIDNERDTEITLQELYINKSKRDEQVHGIDFSKHDKTTTSDFILDSRYTHYGILSSTEKSGLTRIREQNETVIMLGNQDVHNQGDYDSLQRGSRTTLLLGIDTSLSAFVRMIVTWGLSMRVQLLDSGWSVLKSTMALLDFKEAIWANKFDVMKIDAKLAKFAPAAFVIRTYAACLKAYAAAVGTPRF
ncbi:MAG TPA: hypothetical protein VE621_24600 [Bryobacteraceae bacterium]|nr:hypothetical protein [Bryobacteraceae bacterium]